MSKQLKKKEQRRNETEAALSENEKLVQISQENHSEINPVTIQQVAKKTGVGKPRRKK
jgi:DNA-binding MurR/RpiR family transcriptional regulator